MFTLTSEPLTLEIVQALPAGALKLWQVAQLEPQASQARYQELTGYAERTVRAFTRILESMGLVKREVPGKANTRQGRRAAPKREVDDLTPPQQVGYQKLLAMGVGKRQAHDLAQTCALDEIESSIRYVQSRAQIKNRAGYLVRRLQERLQETRAGQPAYETARDTEPAPMPEIGLGGPEASQIQIDRLATKDSLPLTPESLTQGTASVIAPIQASTAQYGTHHEFQLLAYSVSVACGCDFVVDPDALESVDKLYRAGYRAEDVGYFLKQYWPTIWPGKTGEPPTVQALLEHIGHSRHLLNMASGISAGDELLRRVEKLRKHIAGEAAISQWDDLLPEFTGNPQFSPYFEHPRYRRQAEAAEKAAQDQERQDWEEYERNNCPECQRARDLCKCQQVAAIPRRVKDFWLATLGQLQIQLNKSTYDTWLRHIDLVSYDGQHLVAEVPHRYAQDWIRQHLLYSMTKTFNEFMRFLDPEKPTEKAITIEIEVVPEPV